LTYSIPSRDSSHEEVELILSFLSPITPTSTLRQSIPASYITIYVKGTFDIDVYVDVNGQWVSGDRGSQITWELEQAHAEDKYTKKLKTWSIKRRDELLFTEYSDRAEWGTMRFTGPDVSIDPWLRLCLVLTGSERPP